MSQKQEVPAVAGHVTQVVFVFFETVLIFFFFSLIPPVQDQRRRVLMEANREETVGGHTSRPFDLCPSIHKAPSHSRVY